MSQGRPVTLALLVVIGIVFAVELVSGALMNDATLASMGAILPGTLERHDYWRLLAAMFLHGGWLHILTNGWAIYQLCGLYERMFGSGRLLLIYFASGLFASVASAIHLTHVYEANDIAGASVGASGAIFGVLGAFIFSIRRSPLWRHQPWTKSLLSQLMFWIVLNLGLGLSIKVIDDTAHFAGLVAGLLLGFLPHRVAPPPPAERVIDVTPQ